MHCDDLDKELRKKVVVVVAVEVVVRAKVVRAKVVVKLTQGVVRVMQKSTFGM